MVTKKNKKGDEDEDVSDKKKSEKETDEDSILGEDAGIDPAIIEDTFIEEFSEYNDVDNF